MGKDTFSFALLWNLNFICSKKGSVFTFLLTRLSRSYDDFTAKIYTVFSGL